MKVSGALAASSNGSQPSCFDGRADDDAHQLIAAKTGELRNLVLRRHHRPRPAAIEPVAQFIRRQQRGRGDHDDAEFHRRQHGLPERHDIAEQQQQMIAALQPLRTQEVGDLVGTPRQRGKGEFRLPVAAGIDDPQRRAILALGVAREFRVEPIQRPVERNRIGPAESLYRSIVIRAVLEQKGARFLECRHQVFPGETPNVLDNSGKVDPAMAGGVERLVDFLRVLAERRRRAGRLGRVLRQRQILHHEGRCEAGLVIVVGRRSRHRPGTGQ